MTEELTRKLKALIARKEMYFQRFQLLYNKSKNVNNDKVLKEFMIRYATIEKTKQEIDQVIEDINLVNLQLNEDYRPNYQELETVDELYCYINNVAKNVIQAETREISAATPPPVVVESSVRLPKIELISFDGNPLKFPLFYQTFKSLIHDNPKLDDVSKMHYLLGKLSSNALSLTTGMLPTADNYQILWNALIEKYDDKRTLANMYLSQILDFKPIQNENLNSLNLFIEKVDGSINALRKLNLDKLDDFILTAISLVKLDKQTQTLFERSLSKGCIPCYNDLSDFIKEQIKILTRTSGSNITTKSNFSGTYKPKVVHSFTAKESNYKGFICPMCKSTEHRLFKCSKYLKLSTLERIKFVKEHTLCFNCLSSNHGVSFCNSPWRCQKCKRCHNTTIHADDHPSTANKTSETNELIQGNKVTKPTPVSVSLCSTTVKEISNQHYTVLLATAVVNVLTPLGEAYRLRFLIDSASQCHFITTKCCKKLKLPISKASTSVSGIGSSAERVRGQTLFTFTSQYDADVSYQIQALVIDKISEELPTCVIDQDVYKQFSHLHLADDNFYKPGNIDGMIGAELVPHILQSTKFSTPNFPVAIDSTLGFIVMGKAKASNNLNDVQVFCCINSSPTIDSLLQQFWEVEEVSQTSSLSPDDIECENLYKQSIKREKNGRYTVSLPFRIFPPNLGKSYDTALRRLNSLERRFSSSSSFYQEYCAAMQDYIAQGHIQLDNSNLNNQGYYIPHHGVFKESSSTPLRIVFDASAKTTNNLSLNDVLYTGEKLQADVVKILINFRLFQYAITSDVRQMYRQITMCPEHRPYQRLLWRFSPEQPIQTYVLATVAFGVKSSPYLALRTVRQLAFDEEKRFPLASKVVLRDTYMDDVISSIDSFNTSKTLINELVGLFMAGGFDLVKWASNSAELVEEVPVEKCLNQVVEFNHDYLKVLGLQWHPTTDYLTYAVKVENKKCTKRNILSTVARIWDPLGLLTPVTLYAKLLIKELWVLKLAWDEPTPEYIKKLWSDFQNELNELAEFQIPRHIGANERNPIMLLGFSDASERAYAATIYARVPLTNGEYMVTLLCAKAKVAPLKTLSIPKLELLSCLLLAKLLSVVSNTYSNRVIINKTYAFSDSLTALNWVNDSPHRWKTFVANRVSKIQSLLNCAVWFHINGDQNPADCASRGLSPKEFVSNNLFLSGPSWLSLDESKWPVKPFEKSNTELTILEAKPCSLAVIQPKENQLYSLILQSSSWTKLLRGTVYVLRFCKILKGLGNIQAEDLNKAELVLIRVIQSIHFPFELQNLEKGRLCSPSLRPLRPFLKDNILRVGGRLANSIVSYDQQHPILLPKKDHLTELLIDFYHKTNMHTGPHLLLSLIRQKFWILSARSVVRQIVQKCNHCFRTKPRSNFPLMADLPSYRVTQAKAFLHTGVDYAGPFQITLTRHRGVKSQKAYLCLFICMATRAVHLELATSLSTDSFLAALKRFLSRRGPCSVLYSDCGTNFIGANNELKALYEFSNSHNYRQSFGEELASKRITWKFNPPSASHFGGIWEANIKVVKTHLSKVIGEQILSYEEFITVLAQVESLMNSRPLCWLSSDPAEPSVLTPAHFLTLTPLKFFPANDQTHKTMSILKRKELLDQIVQSYWRRWHQEYLSNLQLRQKWNTPTCPVKPGLLVIIRQDNVPPLRWPIGIIDEVFAGSDGVIRVANIRTKDGVFKRPVTKLCPLPSQ